MMRKVKINNSDKKITVGHEVYVAESFFERLRGLMFRTSILGDGLLIKRCNSIHTFFMRYPLDVVFISSELKIVKILRNVKPWRVTFLYLKSSMTLELMGNSLSPDVKAGDQLEVADV